MTSLRKKLREIGAEFKVVKNTMIRLAAKGSDFEKLEAFFTGPTALALTHGDPVALAKAMREFVAGSQKIRLKAGLFEGRVLGVKDVESLAEVPPRDVLLSRLAGGLMSPVSRLVQALTGPQRKLVYALDSIHKKQSEQKTA
jgi:large subunit ribosomal protein L10